MTVRLLCVAALLCIPAAAWADTGAPPPVAVVFGEHSFNQSPRSEGAGARGFMQTVMTALDKVGVPYAKLKDSDVEAGALSGYRVAIFPYNFVVPEAEQDAIVRYVEGGGKIFVFYSLPERVAELLGIRFQEHVSGDFHSIRLQRTALDGLPVRITQDSWNMYRFAPVSSDVRVIGEWLDSEGRPLREPALFLSPNGAYMTHVMTGMDYLAKGRMLLAVLGHLAPEVWPRAARRTIGSVSLDLNRVAERLSQADLAKENRRRAKWQLDEARKDLSKAEELAEGGRFSAAVVAATEVREQAVSMFALTSPERLAEFRGVWIHDAYGVPGEWGWQRSIRELQRHGFNAIIPNMLWAGLAHYPSEFLPVAPEVEGRGDQIADCLRWCKQYGIELHVWKVNYNLSTAPEEFIEKLRDEGRLQRHRDGSEIRWLCPSDPRNLALERDSMLEVVRKYDVDGIHFDYIRYPHNQACYCDGCRRRFEEAVGASAEDWPEDVLEEPLKRSFDQWRRDQITRLVREVSTEAHRIQPGIMVSAAVFDYPSSLDWVNQDWKAWVDEGLLDFVCPMDYMTDAERLEQTVARQVEVVGGRIPLYPGIGEFIITDTRVLLGQLERARRIGADGFVLFCYEHLAYAQGRMAALHASHTAHLTRRPHPAPSVQFVFPQGISDQPSLTYPLGSEITVEVSLTGEGNYAAPIARASGSVWLETTAGSAVRELGELSSDDAGPIAVKIEAPPGRYRIAVGGTVSLSSPEDRKFVVRSRPFEVIEPGRSD